MNRCRIEDHVITPKKAVRCKVNLVKVHKWTKEQQMPMNLSGVSGGALDKANE